MKKAKGQQREEKAVSVAAGPIYRKIRRRFFSCFPFSPSLLSVSATLSLISLSLSLLGVPQTQKEGEEA